MPDFPPKKNVAFTFRFAGLVSQADPTAFKTNPTLAAGDVKVSLDGGAPANITTLPSAISSSAVLSVPLSQTEMNSDEIVILFHDAAGAEWCDASIRIPTVARQLSDLGYPATSGRSMVVDAAGLVDANVVKVGPTGAGTAQTARDLGANIVPRKNVALANFEFYMIDSTDLHSPKTGLAVTAQRSIDGAAFAACANAVAEVANGVYKISLAAADLNGDVVTLKFTAAGAEATVVTLVLQP